MNAVRVGFAIVVVAAFAVFALFLVANADTTDQSEWERWVYVFGAVQAIAFAAVGWVFGREVNRERAEKAEGRAEEAEAAKMEERDRGAKLAGMVLGEAGLTGDAPAGPRLESQRAGEPAPSSAVEFARREYGF